MTPVLATLGGVLYVAGGVILLTAFALGGLIRLELQEKAKAEADPESDEYRLAPLRTNQGRRLPPPRPPRNPNHFRNDNAPAARERSGAGHQENA